MKTQSIVTIFILILISACASTEKQNYEKNSLIEYSDPMIENIGVNIDYYDEETGMAGDFRFDKFTYDWGPIYNEKIFYDYGEPIKRNGEVVRDPQPIFILPLGTKVHALTDGKVVSIKTLYSNDLTIHVQKPDNPKWIYEHEHVINPLVKEGDSVTAGQIIAEVSDYNKWLKEDGYGTLDIGILDATPESGTPTHHCPFFYINEDKKQEIFDKINSLYDSWEIYVGNDTLYDQSHVLPGCIVIEPINR